MESSYLVFLGKVPYKDFLFPYTPLTIWLGGLVFKVAGVGILKLRFLALLASSATVLAGFWIARKIANIKIAVLSTAAILVWCFPQNNFLWPSSLAVLPFFITILFTLRWIEKRQKKFALLAGISVALTILTKQNLGFSLLVAILLSQLYLKTKNKIHLKIWPFLVGMVIILIPSCLALIITNPKLAGFRELAFRSLNAGGGTILSTKYPSINFVLGNPAGNLKSLAKLFLYYSPFLLMLSALIAGIRGIKFNPSVSVVLVCGTIFSLTMTWPTADLAHFTFGVPVLILAFTSISSIPQKTTQLVSLYYILFFLVIGLYKTFFMNYYTFETPYLRLQRNVYIRGEKIRVDEKHAIIINQLNQYKETLFKDKTIFVHPYAPMVYFVLDKIPPIPNLYTQEGLISKNSIRSDIQSLDVAKPDFVIVEKWREMDSEITRFIKTNYRPVTSIWDLDVWQRM